MAKRLKVGESRSYIDKRGRKVTVKLLSRTKGKKKSSRKKMFTASASLDPLTGVAEVTTRRNGKVTSRKRLTGGSRVSTKPIVAKKEVSKPTAKKISRKKFEEEGFRGLRSAGFSVAESNRFLKQRERAMEVSQRTLDKVKKFGKQRLGFAADTDTEIRMFKTKVNQNLEAMGFDKVNMNQNVGSFEDAQNKAFGIIEERSKGLSKAFKKTPVGKQSEFIQLQTLVSTGQSMTPAQMKRFNEINKGAQLKLDKASAKAVLNILPPVTYGKSLIRRKGKGELRPFSNDINSFVKGAWSTSVAPIIDLGKFSITSAYNYGKRLGTSAVRDGRVILIDDIKSLGLGIVKGAKTATEITKKTAKFVKENPVKSAVIVGAIVSSGISAAIAITLDSYNKDPAKVLGQSFGLFLNPKQLIGALKLSTKGVIIGGKQVVKVTKATTKSAKLFNKKLKLLLKSKKPIVKVTEKDLIISSIIESTGFKKEAVSISKLTGSTITKAIDDLSEVYTIRLNGKSVKDLKKILNSKTSQDKLFEKAISKFKKKGKTIKVQAEKNLIARTISENKNFKTEAARDLFFDNIRKKSLRSLKSILKKTKIVTAKRTGIKGKTVLKISDLQTRKNLLARTISEGKKFKNEKARELFFENIRKKNIKDLRSILKKTKISTAAKPILKKISIAKKIKTKAKKVIGISNIKEEKELIARAIAEAKRFDNDKAREIFFNNIKKKSLNRLKIMLKNTKTGTFRRTGVKGRKVAKISKLQTRKNFLARTIADNKTFENEAARDIFFNNIKNKNIKDLRSILSKSGKISFKKKLVGTKKPKKVQKLAERKKLLITAIIEQKKFKNEADKGLFKNILKKKTLKELTSMSKKPKIRVKKLTAKDVKVQVGGSKRVTKPKTTKKAAIDFDKIRSKDIKVDVGPRRIIKSKPSKPKTRKVDLSKVKAKDIKVDVGPRKIIKSKKPKPTTIKVDLSKVDINDIKVEVLNNSVNEKIINKSKKKAENIVKKVNSKRISTNKVNRDINNQTRQVQIQVQKSKSLLRNIKRSRKDIRKISRIKLRLEAIKLKSIEIVYISRLLKLNKIIVSASNIARLVSLIKNINQTNRGIQAKILEISKTLRIPRIAQKEEARQIELLAFNQGITQKSLNLVDNIELQAFKSAQKKAQVQKTKTVQEEKSKKVPKVPKLHLNSKLNKGERFAFTIIYRSKGKIKNVNVRLPQNRALKMAKEFIDNSVHASMQLLLLGKTKAKDISKPLLNKFRLSRTKHSLKLVEKVKHRIDTKGEKKGLKIAKLIRAFKKKK